MVPSVNNVRLTGPDGANPAGRAARMRPAAISSMAARRICRSRRSARSRHTRRSTNAPAQRLLDDLAAFQNVLFSSPRVRALSDAVRGRRDAAAGCRSAAERARAAGQGGVHARLRAVPWRARPVDHAGAAAAALPRHQLAVSAPGRYRGARALHVRAVPAAARAQRAHLRDHARPTARWSGGRARIPVARC